jgi:membrane-associated phospholipid phosphatase
MKRASSLLLCLVVMLLSTACAATIDPSSFLTVAPPVVAVDALMPEAAQWETWVLNSADELRPAAPPNSAATAAELAELKEIVAVNDDAAKAAVAYWDAGAPTYRWLELALAEYGKGPPNPRVSRGLALLNVAIYDAIVATWDAKYAYDRPRPVGVDALIAMPAGPSYPSEHAAAAGAASTVLAYLFPEQAEFFMAKSEQAAQSRLQAGVHYPSDVEVGLALGKSIGDRVVAWAQSDGSDMAWTGEIPVGPGKWIGENPVTPLAGAWKTWVIDSPDDYLPAPPPAIDSDQMAAELAEIKAVARILPIQMGAWTWHSFDRAYPLWYGKVSTRLFEGRTDYNIPEATKIYTALAVANHDSIVACFHAKYHYWMIRPPHLDTEIVSLFPIIPNHPSYPAAHSCATMASAMVIGGFFPDEAEGVQAAAHEAGTSRIWAGIHYASDRDAGETLAKAVAEAVLARIAVMTAP